MTGPLPDDDGERIRSITDRLGVALTDRVLRASRLASELEACTRWFNDPVINAAIARLQVALAAKLPAPDGDAG